MPWFYILLAPCSISLLVGMVGTMSHRRSILFNGMKILGFLGTIFVVFFKVIGYL